MPNRLADQLSPYLLQHAHNPVDWYPWGPEALERARAEDKPILLSIGYSACHWCHVMERESFEDAETAALMNDRFVNIKVDREERPDLDAIYMAAVQGLTGRGGWPMTVFLTPEGKPFYGGTYFPPEDRGGMPSFKRVLTAISEAYRSRREEVEKQADTIAEFIRRQSLALAPAENLDATVLDRAFVTLTGQFDAAHGGFGRAPKFPQAMTLDFLLAYARRTGNPTAREMVEVSLAKMATGGIYDQLGGGFHRYSVDDRWRVPHFEKMLYDNALLARVYLHAHQLTGKPFYRRIAEETLDYLLRDMRDPRGGFFSAQDADSAGEEGAYYLWTVEAIRQAVGEDEAELAVRYFGVESPGQVEGQSTLVRPSDEAAFAAGVGIGLEELVARIERIRERLLAARRRRVPPATDDKLLTVWNGLALRSLSEAARVLDRSDYRQAAEATAEFLLRELVRGGQVWRVHRAGSSTTPGYLEDYASLADGLLALYEATFAVRWVEAARAVAAWMLERFWDRDQGVLFDVEAGAEPLVARPKERWDNATPSGTSLACQALLRLWALTAEPQFERVARSELARAIDLMGEGATGMGNLLAALDFYLGPPLELAVLGDPADPRTRQLLQAAGAGHHPHLVVAAAHPGDTHALASIPLLRDRPLLDGLPTAYLCRGQVCDRPTTDAQELLAQLG